MYETKGLSRARLHELLHYNQSTGVFKWRMCAGRHGRIHAGSVAGCTNKTHGYHEIWVDGVLQKAHRLAWMYVKGRWPKQELDHRNGVKHDNRFSNLRECNRSEQHQNRKLHANSTSGFTGVSWKVGMNKWQARISINRKRIFLGHFKSKNAAAKAYVNAKAQFHTFNPEQRSLVCIGKSQ